MFKITLYFYFLLIPILLSKNTKLEPIRLKFIQKSELNMNETNVMETLYSQNLITTISLGTPNQNFNVHLRTDSYSIYIIGPEIISSYDTFNPKISSTYKKLDEVDYIFNEDFKSADLSQDKFILGNKEIKDVDFSLVKELSFLKRNKSSGVIGLRLDTKKKNETLYNTSLINKLYLDKKISKNSFYFHFDERDLLNKDLKDNKNELIIGAYPHQFTNEYSEKNLTKIKLQSYDNNLILGLEFNNIFYGNNDLKGVINSRFIFDSGLIIAPFVFKDTIFKLFFKDRINKKCFSEDFKLRSEYSYYYCNNNDEIKNDIKKMESLKFILKNENFTFEIKPEKLWYEYKDKLYYLVLFPRIEKELDPFWKLGIPFLKNYDLIFDKESKTLNVYTQKVSSENKTNYLKYLIIIFVIVVFIVIIILIVINYNLIKKLPRKKRANELEDTYEYLQETDKNGNSKLIN